MAEVARSLTQAIEHQRAGRTDEAWTLCQIVLDAHPRHPEALHLMGLFARDRGALSDAVDLVRQALSVRPGDVVFLDSLGSILQLQGAYQEAVETLAECLSVEPSNLNALFGLGTALLHVGRFTDAAEKLKRYTVARPWSAQGHLHLGSALAAAGQYAGARASLEEAIRREPANAYAHATLGIVCCHQGDFDLAEASFQEALSLHPDSANILVKLAHLYFFSARLDEAENCLERARVLAPTSPRVLSAQASLLERRGRIPEATALLQPLVDEGLQEVELARTWATLCERQGRPGEAVDLLRSTLSVAMPTEERIKLLHKQAEILDKLERFDEAMASLHEANGLRGLRFDREAWVEKVDGILQVFAETRDMDSGQESESPLFVVGMPRAGTTLVEQILASHPQVHGAGELPGIMQIANSLPFRLGVASPWPQCVEHLNEEVLQHFAGAYLEQSQALSEGSLRVVDKMPHNFQFIGLLGLLFPRARVIHCRRDPLDSCLSAYFQYFSRWYDFAASLEDLGHYYSGYERLMAHWRVRPPLPMLEVPYEALVTDPEAWIPRIVDFAGLPWDEACLSPHAHLRTVQTASYAQVREPIHGRSVGRSRHYESHLEPLKQVLDSKVGTS